MASYLQNKILCQCQPGADVLFDNFRNDISCEVLKQFRKRGVTLQNLLDLQMVIPAIYPWDEEYDNLRYNVNRRFVVFPFIIVMAETTKHVAIAVEWAYKREIQVVARSGSGCFENFSLINGMIIDQSRRTNISIQDSVSILEPGCLLGPTQLELSKEGLAFVGGSSENTCVAGLTLGGGIGFLARRYGLSSDNLLEAEVVLYNGEVVIANSKNNVDLFWALRGAGNSNYGIVTKFVFKVHRISEVIIFDAIFQYDRIKEVINAWQYWAPFTDDNLTAELNIYNDRLMITGQYLGCKESLKRLLQPIIKMNPVEYTVQRVPFIDAVRHLLSDKWYPFFKNKSGFVETYLPSEAINIIDEYMKCGGPEDHVEFHAFGGMVSRIPSNKTAFPHRAGTLYWCHIQCHWAKQDCTDNKLKWVNNFYNELEPYLKGAYVNAADIDLMCPLEKYYGNNLSKLMKIKKIYDPKNIFNYPQSIPPE